MNTPLARHLGSVLALLIACIGIALVQPRLAAALKDAKRDDITALPPPAQLRAMTLGYRTAGADMLWAKLIVEHGLHCEEKRAFPDMTRYIDGIIELDPDHPLIYEFVDSLLLYAPKAGTEADARLARRYLEQATKARPYDADVWLRYGQFVAFLAASYLKDRNEIEAWRKEGALAIAHAVDLGADADRGLSAASILSKAGERTATIEQLQRHYALTDDPETRRRIMIKLQSLNANVEAEATVGIVEHQWRTYFPFLSRGTTLLLGPRRSPAACAGPRSYALKECPRDWAGVTRDTF